MTIRRIPDNARMSAAVVVNGIAFLKGVTADPETRVDIREQTRNVLAKIDLLLAKAGTSRDKLLSVNIWLKNIADRGAMNEIYDSWVISGDLPVRACVEANLARAACLIEVQVSAACGD